MVHILQTPTFKKAVKKLHKQEKALLDAAIRTLIQDPTQGDRKVGDLAGVFVLKFPMNKQQTLLAYRYTETPLTIELLALGHHENFYRTIKRS